mmetsp:Transcript_24968/g.63335  ORF Transcript_24968/g.63335 Transcript_24968/m.63335 type:complete len:170 (+) Transcript_24968:219-728(+)
MHADTRCFESPELLTAFVALQDVSEAMGPTTFLTGTQNPLAHAAMLDPARKAGLLGAGPVRLGQMPAGGSTLYDTRLLHGGGTHTSALSGRRWLFYATFGKSRAVADEFHGREYAQLQREVHTVASLSRRGSDGQVGALSDEERSRSEDEAKEWELVWAKGRNSESEFL